MIWKIIGVIALITLFNLLLLGIYAFKQFLDYMIGNEDDDYYKEELAALDQEGQKE